MEIRDNDALRSLTNEAGRQSCYYDRRLLSTLAQMWSELEALAFSASRTKGVLVVEVRHLADPKLNTERESSSTTPIIKPCEQVQQPQKHYAMKGLQ